MRPKYAVNIGAESFRPETGNEVISLRIIRSIGAGIDSCEVVLVGSNGGSFQKDDQVRIQLGYDQELMLVFSGLVDRVEHDLSTVRVTALGLSVSLLRLRLNRVYLNQTAGKIVRDLAQEVDLPVKEASDGISFPSYIVDDVANAYEHVLNLSDRCNFDVYLSEDGQLVFKKWDGGNTHSLQYGKEIIRVEGSDYSPLYVSTRIYGESPASRRGSDTFHWLTKQEVKGEAGSGSVLTIHDPAIRDRQTAERYAEAKLNGLQHTSTLVVEIVGNPDLRLGDAVSIEGVPTPTVNGVFQVRSIDHYLSKSKGFTSRVNCWRKGGSVV